ncbi:hypothetical protein HOY80DRAFT_958073 [Tuber brumale]|nr:hypothetical protein HOY80DRAFT_958073 [Tuber brumale]
MVGEGGVRVDDFSCLLFLMLLLLRYRTRVRYCHLFALSYFLFFLFFVPYDTVPVSPTLSLRFPCFLFLLFLFLGPMPPFGAVLHCAR